MSVSMMPRRPVENWEAVRDEWIDAAERIAGDVELWAREQHWLVHRGAKPITEDRIGSYEVPLLTIPDLRGPPDPRSDRPLRRWDFGSDRLCVFPSYESCTSSGGGGLHRHQSR